MAVIMTPSGRTPPLTEADQARAVQELIAYSGDHRLAPPNRFVTTVDVAWFQPWLGTAQARSFDVDGGTLNIVTDPSTTPLTGDAPVVGVLSWRREAVDNGTGETNQR